MGQIAFKASDQVRSSLARRLGMDIGALAPADRNVEGVVEMMLDATQKYREPLTAERLFGWHAALFPTGRSGMHKIITGGWRDDRNCPMQVVSGAVGRERVHYEAAPAARVDADMKAFLGWFNAAPDTDPVLKADIAHLWFVTIHPFDDGNGRIARAIADMALARSEGRDIGAVADADRLHGGGALHEGDGDAGAHVVLARHHGPEDGAVLRDVADGDGLVDGTPGGGADEACDIGGHAVQEELRRHDLDVDVGEKSGGQSDEQRFKQMLLNLWTVPSNRSLPSKQTRAR